MLDNVSMLLIWLCCLACQIQPKGDNEAGASQEFVDRVLHGTRAIAEYMGVSSATISRWRTRFRGQEEARLCFPVMFISTGKGWGLRMISSTALIKEWMERWGVIDAAQAQLKAKWRRRTSKVKRIGETNKLRGGPTEEKKPELPREEPPVHLESRLEPLPEPPVSQPALRRQSGNQRPEGCVCGTGLDCQAHGEPD